MKFKLGSDPELMLTNNEGKLKSAINIFKAGKGEGEPIGEENGNSVLHDNVLVEFNTVPSKSEKEFIKTISSVMEGIYNKVKQLNLNIKIQSSADYPKEELNCPEAVKFGCEVDYSAWELEINEVDVNAQYKTFRSAGGHLHIGKHTDKKLNKILDCEEGKVNIIKILDIFCGITEVIVDKDTTSKSRRNLYGKAGAFRPKSYGVEYRTLGNWWISGPKETSLVYNLTNDALKYLTNKDLNKLIKDIGEDNIINTINNCDYNKALSIFNDFIKPNLSSKTNKLFNSVNNENKTKDKQLWDFQYQ